MIIVFVILSCILIPILYIFLGLQLIALGDFVKSGLDVNCLRIVTDPRRYLEYKEYLYLILFLIVLTIFSLLWNTLFSQRAKEKYKVKHITLQEKREHHHIASAYEARKGTTRIEFDNKGQSKGNATIRGFFDVTFNDFKKLWNKMIVFFKLSDVHKFNTLKDWHIEGNKSGRRAGLPIYTKRGRVYCDAEDTNSLIVGSTRSGKTYGLIHILIQLLRMAKESMMIMDVKGELYMKHAQSLRNDGYDVFRVDFIHPKKSVKWNPLGVIVKKYRQAYNEWLSLMQEDEYQNLQDEIYTKHCVLNEIRNKKKTPKSNNDFIKLDRKEKIIEREIEELLNILPKPDYSKAKEYSLDIAMTLCNDESKDPFWPSSAATLLDGYINFLLEEKIDDGNGGWTWLPDKMINMYSVKMLHDLGKTPLDPKQYEGCDTVLGYYIKKYKKPDDTSTMKLKAYIDAPQNTAGSISSVFDDKIKYFLANENILAMTAESDFELTQLGTKKTAIFVCVHDEKSTFHSLASIMFSQIYEELIEEARDIAERTHTDIQRLKRDVFVVWDEFANGARWDNIGNALSAALSRGIRYCLVIQDYGQLERLYHDLSATIKSNCQNTFFLLANDNKTKEDISKACGTRIRWDRNKQQKVEEPCISADRLGLLSMGEAVILRGRKNPYISRLLGFDSYNFTKNLPKTPHEDDKKLDNVQKYNILKAWKQKKDNDDKLKFEMNKAKSDRSVKLNESNKNKQINKPLRKENIAKVKSKRAKNDDFKLEQIQLDLKIKTDEERKQMMKSLNNVYLAGSLANEVVLHE